MESSLLDRITINPAQCGGRPCIRGYRIRVTDVLDLLGAGLTVDEVLEELENLEPEDIQAVMQYASIRMRNPVLAA
jgi:uncharacterized protein (DUF433 family)